MMEKVLCWIVGHGKVLELLSPYDDCSYVHRICTRCGHEIIKGIVEIEKSSKRGGDLE